MKQDPWIEQLREKLAEHKVAPPEGLWEDIEAALQQHFPVVHDSHMIADILQLAQVVR